MYGGLWKPEVLDFYGADITGNCESLDMGAGSRTQVLCKSSTCFELLSHLFSPGHFFFWHVNLPKCILYLLTSVC